MNKKKRPKLIFKIIMKYSKQTLINGRENNNNSLAEVEFKKKRERKYFRYLY